MTLRTPNPYRSYQTILDFTRSKERLAHLQEQITRDKRIVRLSDDPTGASLIMDFQTSIDRNKMFVKQGQSASSFLKGTESALNSIEIQIDRLLELGQQGLSDTNAGHGREAIAAEVDGLRTLLLDISNSKEQGKYLFAGTNTQTMPFSFSSAALVWPPTGSPYNPNVDGSVNYSGNRGTIDLDISPTASITTNLTGEYVFQGVRDSLTDELDPSQDIFNAVTLLRDALQSDDRALIQEAYDNIREIKNRINVCLTTVGSRHVQIENTGMNLEDFNESLQSIQNTYDEVDYPWAISQFSAEQASQQATLQVLSRMGRNNLFDYIG